MIREKYYEKCDYIKDFENFLSFYENKQNFIQI